MGNICTHAFAYADDVIILAPTCTALNNMDIVDCRARPRLRPAMLHIRDCDLGFNHVIPNIQRGPSAPARSLYLGKPCLDLPGSGRTHLVGLYMECLTGIHVTSL